MFVHHLISIIVITNHCCAEHIISSMFDFFLYIVFDYGETLNCFFDHRIVDHKPKNTIFLPFNSTLGRIAWCTNVHQDFQAQSLTNGWAHTMTYTASLTPTRNQCSWVPTTLDGRNIDPDVLPWWLWKQVVLFGMRGSTWFVICFALRKFLWQLCSALRRTDYLLWLIWKSM